MLWYRKQCLQKYMLPNLTININTFFATVSSILAYRCVMRHDINVAFNPDDFLLHGGFLCIHNHTSGPAETGLVVCTQPVVGQYLTIKNLEHGASEPYSVQYERCMTICEIKIFVRGT